MTDEQFMRLALAQAQMALEKSQSPFGALISRGSEIIVATHNHVLAEGDPTAHAEVEAIRQASAALHTIDLAGCTIYTTTEPCPMCFSAIHWAHLDRIVYGASIADAQAIGFRELAISNEMMKQLGQSPVLITAHVLAQPCAAMFEEYRKRGGRLY